MSNLVALKKLDWCSTEDLADKVGDLQVDVSDVKTFSCEEDALVHANSLDLDGAVAVPFMEPKLPADAIKAIDKLRARATELQEKLKTFAMIDPVTGLETWKTLFEADILEKASQFKSKLKTCQDCGSAISVPHIKSINCPVCTAPFLVTTTESDKIRTKETKIKAMKDEIVEALFNASETESKRMKESTEFKRMWLIAGPESVVGGASEEMPPADEYTEGTGPEFSEDGPGDAEGESAPEVETADEQA